MANILKLLPKLIVSILIAIFWIDYYVAGAIALLGFIITVPAIIYAIYLTITSRKLSNKWQKVLFAWGIFNIIFFCAYIIFWYPIQGCTPNKMAKHYDKNSQKIGELIKYVEEAQNDSTVLVLEFDSEGISRFYISTNKGSYETQGEDAEIKKDSLMQEVGLTHSEYENIRAQLNEINCIGIRNNKRYPEDGVTIDFKREGCGLYSFIIHNNPINQKQKDMYMKYEGYIPYNDTVIFEYGSGAIGSFSFPKKGKEKFLRKHKPW